MTEGERQIIADCNFSDLGMLFPEYPLAELKIVRARIKKVRNQQLYHRRHYGPSIPEGACQEYETRKREALAGSAMLLQAIVESGLRP